MRLKRIAVAVVVALALVLVGGHVWADSSLRKDIGLSGLPNRPDTGGTNYLIVGSDSREGLSKEDQKRLRVGYEPTKRADTMMILHADDDGSTLVSLPRDSWVEIPAYRGAESGKDYPAERNKLNAAYAFGGSGLLAQTVEANTGLRIHHVVEVGFAGFEQVVDAVGGVEIDVPRRIKDKNSGADFQPGVQTLNGAQALAYARQRYQEPEGDLGRTKNQQTVLHALSEAVGPANGLKVANAVFDTVRVDKDFYPIDLVNMGLALKDAERMNVPVSNPGYHTDKGSTVLWSVYADDLWKKLR
ncbi:LCP family protein [Streptomyces sp. NPDC127112]|uniref:LCP family protein n=1 Tax=Streptomyces sp. NPDC127112 TaxID=3345364 RepID=UPI003643CE4B